LADLIFITERERVRKDSIRVEEKRKHLGESERRFDYVSIQRTKIVSVRTSKRTQHVSVTKIRWLILLKEMASV
jgi:hypothetical protein